MTKPAAEIGCAFCGAYVTVDDAAMAQGISWQCDCPDVPAPAEERSGARCPWRARGDGGRRNPMPSPILLDVERLDREKGSSHATYWEGETDDGKRVLIRYHWWRVRIEIGDAVIVSFPVGKDHPGTDCFEMSNAGLKQAIILFPHPWFVLPF